MGTPTRHTKPERSLDVRVYTHGENKLLIEYGTTMSTLKAKVRASGMRIAHMERASDGKTDVYVSPRYKGTDPYTGEVTYAGYRPRSTNS